MVVYETQTSTLPRIAELRRSLESAGEEFVQSYLRFHEIWSERVVDARMLRARTLGPAEMARARARLRMHQGLRKLELYREAELRGESNARAAIERRLALDLSSPHRELSRLRDEVEVALRDRARVRHPERDREAKRLFALLVASLHPELWPAPSSELCARWVLVVDAFEARDLSALGSLMKLAASGQEARYEVRGSAEEKVKQLEAWLERLQLRLKRQNGAIAQMLASSPYSLLERLEDPAWVERRVRAIEVEARTLEAEADEYERALYQLGIFH